MIRTTVEHTVSDDLEMRRVRRVRFYDEPILDARTIISLLVIALSGAIGLWLVTHI